MSVIVGNLIRPARITRRRTFACLGGLLFALAAFPVVYAAQSVAPPEHGLSVLVLDVDTGTPAKGITVFLTFLPAHAGSATGTTEKTDSHGIATFRLIEPLPDRLGISFSANEFGSCSKTQFDSDQVLNEGIIGLCKDSKFKYDKAPTPAHIVVFGKKLTLWQRMRREIP